MPHTSKMSSTHIERLLLDKVSRNQQTLPCDDELRYQHSSPKKVTLTIIDDELASEELLEIDDTGNDDEEAAILYAAEMQQKDEYFENLQLSKSFSDEEIEVAIDTPSKADDVSIKEFYEAEEQKALKESQKNIADYYRSQHFEEPQYDALPRTQKDFRNPARLFSFSESMPVERTESKAALRR